MYAIEEVKSDEYDINRSNLFYFDHLHSEAKIKKQAYKYDRCKI